jgi:hypothetical protein
MLFSLLPYLIHISYESPYLNWSHQTYFANLKEFPYKNWILCCKLPDDWSNVHRPSVLPVILYRPKSIFKMFIKEIEHYKDESFESRMQWKPVLGTLLWALLYVTRCFLFSCSAINNNEHCMSSGKLRVSVMIPVVEEIKIHMKVTQTSYARVYFWIKGN